MDSDDYELPDIDGKDRGPNSQDEPKNRPLFWPWLVLIGLLAIGIGVIGALVI